MYIFWSPSLSARPNMAEKPVAAPEPSTAEPSGAVAAGAECSTGAPPAAAVADPAAGIRLPVGPMITGRVDSSKMMNKVFEPHGAVSVEVEGMRLDEAAAGSAVFKLPVGPKVGRIDSSQMMNKVFAKKSDGESSGSPGKRIRTGSGLNPTAEGESRNAVSVDGIRANEAAAVFKLPVGPKVGRIDSSQMMNKVFEIKSDRQSGGSPSKKTRTGSGLNPNA